MNAAAKKFGPFTFSASGCWEWNKVDAQGYGRVYRGRGYVGAHRHFFERAKGPIPDGFVVDHLCGNRRCVNPDHLDAVPQRLNALRGRKTRLTTEQASEIRALVQTTRTRELAERFGVTEGHIRAIALGERRQEAAGPLARRGPVLQRRSTKVTPEVYAEIKARRASGQTLRQIAGAFAISIPYTSEICSGALARRYATRI